MARHVYALLYDNHMYSVEPDLKDLQKIVECHMPQQI